MPHCSAVVCKISIVCCRHPHVTCGKGAASVFPLREPVLGNQSEDNMLQHLSLSLSLAYSEDKLGLTDVYLSGRNNRVTHKHLGDVHNNGAGHFHGSCLLF